MQVKLPPPIPISKRKVLFVDVMMGDRYIFTMRYNHCPAFKIDLQDVYNKVVERRPSLKGKRFDMYID